MCGSSTVLCDALLVWLYNCCCAEPGEAAQVEQMDRGCLLAVQGEGIVGEDYRVFIADGQAVSQVLVLGRRDPDVGGKHIQPHSFHRQRYAAFVKNIPPCQGLLSRQVSLWAAPEIEK